MAKEDGLRFTESIEDLQIGSHANGTGSPSEVSEVRPDAHSISGTEDEDAFDPERLRLNQNFADDLGVKTLLTVRVHKPNRQNFFRVHPDQKYRLTTYLLELKDLRETYLVEPSLVPVLGEEVFAADLFTCVDRSNTVFLWAVKLPSSDGRTSEWMTSAIRIAQLAMTDWVRMHANMSAGYYQAVTATGNLPQPEWPTVSLKDLLKIAFQDRFIRDLNHPVVQKLRGEF